MNLITFKHKEDFGDDYYTQIINIKRWSLLQVSVSWNDYPGWPYLQISFGSNGLLSVLFWVYKFGFCFDVISRTWKWDYMNKIEEEE